MDKVVIMKVLAINGSPRGKNACTYKMLLPAAGMMFVESFKDRMEKYSKDLMVAGKQLIKQNKTRLMRN